MARDSWLVPGIVKPLALLNQKEAGGLLLVNTSEDARAIELYIMYYYSLGKTLTRDKQ